MIMKRILYITLFLLVPVIPLLAQNRQIYNEQINILSQEVEHKGDSLYIHLVVDISNLKVDKNRSLTLTPILGAIEGQLELPYLLINGTTRHKVYQRSQSLGNDEANGSVYEVVKLDRNSTRELHYHHALLYQKWMETAYLDIKEDLCGCGGHQQMVNVERVMDDILPEVIVPEVNPSLAYIQPKVEMVKYRSEQWESYIDFPVNKSTIIPDYLNNAKELAKIQNALKAVRTDNNLTVTRIDIIGFASPEGGIAYNENLSRSRAESFRKYLASDLDFPANIYDVQYGGENWDGLLTAVQTSDLKDKDAIVSIIKNTSDINQRKSKLKSLGGGSPYNRMLKDIYPTLRKVIFNAHYTVQGFSVDKAKELIKARPQQLSLDEMFQVASTYQKGSNDFIDVFETAVRMYPEDQVANLNAAAAALSVKNIKNAEKYLNKADKNTPEYSNNIGVLYLLQENLEQAKNYFSKAAKSGLDSAMHNLEEVEKKIQNK